MEQDCAASTAGAAAFGGGNGGGGSGTAGSATAKYAAALKVPTDDAPRALCPSVHSCRLHEYQRGLRPHCSGGLGPGAELPPPN